MTSERNKNTTASKGKREGEEREEKSIFTSQLFVECKKAINIKFNVLAAPKSEKSGRKFFKDVDLCNHKLSA
jgi:hypothetical protein